MKYFLLGEFKKLTGLNDGAARNLPFLEKKPYKNKYFFEKNCSSTTIETTNITSKED